jgi:hypothetical protein
MPLYVRYQTIPPLVYHKLELLSVTLSAIAYGIVVVLSGNCFHLLQKKRCNYPNRMRIILSIYVIVMFLSSTWRIMGSIYKLMDVLTEIHVSPLLYYSSGMTIIVTMWGADGFMVRILILLQEQRFTIKLQIWRCLVLYQQVSKGPRVVVIVLLSLVSFGSFGRPISISTAPLKLLIKS